MSARRWRMPERTDLMRPKIPYRRLGLSSWRDRAACGSANPKIFQAQRGAAAERAKAWCRACPVAAECLESALVSEDTDGIRGGLTPGERRRLHEAIEKRLDMDRVQAALDGHDIHLSKRERDALEEAALDRGLSTPQLAWLLKISIDQAEKVHAQRHGPPDDVPDEPATEPDNSTGPDHPITPARVGRSGTDRDLVDAPAREVQRLRRRGLANDSSEAAA